MASFQCQVDIPQGPGLKDGKLTVGREFFLKCRGDFPRDLNTENLQLVLEPTQKYALKLLGFEFRSPTEADLKVTSYLATAHKIENLQLSDGPHTLDLGAIHFELTSVLPPPQPPGAGEQGPKQPEPFGPMGPATIPVPPLYWALLLTVIAALIFAFAFRVFRIVQRRKLLERLKEHDSAQAPGTEFYAHYRKLQRQNTVFFGGKAEAEDVPAAVDQLQISFKRYLTRRYQVPALEWPDRLILKELKTYHKALYQEKGEEIKDLLHEFTQAQKDRKKLTETDALKIAQQSQSLVDKLERGVK